MDAVENGDLDVHGLVYDVKSGILKELDVPEDEDSSEYYICK